MKFLLSKIDSFSIPHFNIIWKILKNPPVGRPIVALKRILRKIRRHFKGQPKFA